MAEHKQPSKHELPEKARGHSGEIKTDTKPSKVDEAIDETFPASDPPSYMGGAERIGPPAKRKPAQKH
jgi:hypothetical protein